MNGKLIAGISFQIIQFIILGLIALIGIASNLNVSKGGYYLVFGGIVLLGLNVLSITLIISGEKNAKE